MALEAQELVRTFGGLKAVNKVSLRVGPGEIVGLIGPNGAGKTTCFNLINGQLKPTSGRVLIDGADVTGEPPWKLAARGVARTFQHTSLFGGLTVWENVATAHAANPGSARNEREQAVATALARVAPDADYREAVSELPYGVQRRVAVAIALVNAPNTLLLDEPAAGLNPAESEQLAEVIRSVAASGVGILLVEHNLTLVLGVADRLEVLAAGERLYSGDPKGAMQDEAVVEAYIGRRQS